MKKHNLNPYLLTIFLLLTLHRLKTHLRPEVQLTGSLIEDDDIHLILEYNTGDSWGDLVSPRANRYILHNDHHNPYLSSLEEFNSALAGFEQRHWGDIHRG